MGFKPRKKTERTLTKRIYASFIPGDNAFVLYEHDRPQVYCGVVHRHAWPEIIGGAIKFPVELTAREVA